MIALMTLTSLGGVNRHISAAAWRRIRKTGIYLLGGLFTVSYVVAAIYVLDAKYVVFAAAFVAPGCRAGCCSGRWRRLSTRWRCRVWALHDVRSDQDVGVLIRVCIRCAAGVFLVAFAAPPLQRLALWMSQLSRLR